MKTLFLNPPSSEGFDAGASYQAKHEIKSNWYPTWLVFGSKLVGTPASGKSLDDILPMAKDYELLVMHASAATYPSECKVAEAFKRANPAITVVTYRDMMKRRLREGVEFFQFLRTRDNAAC